MSATRRLRALVGRFLPEGAALLSVLIFGSYLLGLVRDRTFARTFGAGAELDAYNAAFVLPELLLDVLVAAGLAAPFVPIFLRPAEPGRRSRGGSIRPDDPHLAVTVMGVAAVILFVLAAATTAVHRAGLRARRARPVRRRCSG